jgi:hypothetical protein
MNWFRLHGGLLALAVWAVWAAVGLAQEKDDFNKVTEQVLKDRVKSYLAEARTQQALRPILALVDLNADQIAYEPKMGGEPKNLTWTYKPKKPLTPDEIKKVEENLRWVLVNVLGDYKEGLLSDAKAKQLMDVSAYVPSTPSTPTATATGRGITNSNTATGGAASIGPITIYVAPPAGGGTAPGTQDVSWLRDELERIRVILERNQTSLLTAVQTNNTEVGRLRDEVQQLRTVLANLKQTQTSTPGLPGPVFPCPPPWGFQPAYWHHPLPGWYGAYGWTGTSSPVQGLAAVNPVPPRKPAAASARPVNVPSRPAWPVTDAQEVTGPTIDLDRDANKGEEEIAELDAPVVFWRAVRYYLDRHHARSYQLLAKLIRKNPRDARYWYYKALNEKAAGQWTAAQDSARQGAALERLNYPHRSITLKALERVQGPDRRFLCATFDGITEAQARAILQTSLSKALGARD